MREAGRALVLDPASGGAQEILAGLLLAPRAIPAEAKAAADAERAAVRQRTFRKMARGYGALVALMFVTYAFPVRSLAAVLAMHGATALTAALMLYVGRAPRALESRAYLAVVWASCVAIALGGIVFGPLLLPPLFVVALLTGALTQPSRYRLAWVVVPLAAAMAVPLVLEWLHVLPSSYRVEHGSLVITPAAIELTPGGTEILLLVALVAPTVITSWLLVDQRRAQEIAQERTHARAWHFRQLLPREKDS